MRHGVAQAVLAAAIAACMALPATAAAPALTPDQQLVSRLEEARGAARATLRSLTPTSATRGAARAELGQVIEGMRAARSAAPLAIGALATPSVRRALHQGAPLAGQARQDIRDGRRAAARTKVRRFMALTSAALGDFGVPLEKEFPSYAVNRDFSYMPEFAAYSGLSATVGEKVTEIVIGPADRATANAGEPGTASAKSVGLPIAQLSMAVFSDSIGRFNSGWCDLESGLITCRMKPAMPADRIFTIAFGPKLDRGTRLLVKFRAAHGDRSYALFTTR